MSTENTHIPPPAAKRPVLIWLFLAGLLVPLILLALFCLLSRDEWERRAVIKTLDPTALQQRNLEAIRAEIDAYADALTQDPCAMPVLGRDGFFEPEKAMPTLPDSKKPLPAVPPESSTPAEGENLADMVERSTVMVLVSSQQESGTGSGFFVTPNLVLTNRHVVGLVGENAEIHVASKALGGVIPARLIKATDSSELRDYALLEVFPPPGSRPAVLAFAASSKRADRVSAWGYPFLLTRTDPQLEGMVRGDSGSVPEVVYSEGVISVVQNYDGLPLINHTADVSQGSSGGPLVNEQGLVVGINTMIRVDDESSRQVNIALGSNDIVAFATESDLTLARK